MRVEAKISPRAALRDLIGKNLDSLELFKTMEQEAHLCQVNCSGGVPFCAFTKTHDFSDYEAGILHFKQRRCEDPLLTRGPRIELNNEIIEISMLSYDDGEDYFESGVIIRMRDGSVITLCASGFPYMIYVNINNVYSIGVPEYDISDYEQKAI